MMGVQGPRGSRGEVGYGWKIIALTALVLALAALLIVVAEKEAEAQRGGASPSSSSSSASSAGRASSAAPSSSSSSRPSSPSSSSKPSSPSAGAGSKAGSPPAKPAPPTLNRAGKPTQIPSSVQSRHKTSRYYNDPSFGVRYNSPSNFFLWAWILHDTDDPGYEREYVEPNGRGAGIVLVAVAFIAGGLLLVRVAHSAGRNNRRYY